MRKPRKASDVINLKLRLREDLRARLEYAAAEHGRSMNSEINRRLEQSFGYPPERQMQERILLGLLLAMKRREEQGGFPDPESFVKEFMGEKK